MGVLDRRHGRRVLWTSSVFLRPGDLLGSDATTAQETEKVYNVWYSEVVFQDEILFDTAGEKQPYACESRTAGPYFLLRKCNYDFSLAYLTARST